MGKKSIKCIIGQSKVECLFGATPPFCSTLESLQEELSVLASMHITVSQHCFLLTLVLAANILCDEISVFLLAKAAWNTLNLCVYD